MRWGRGVICILCLVWLPGCSAAKLNTEKLRDVEYEQLEETDIPEEMKEPIQERKEEAFLLTYADRGSLYIARGYGKQETDGYEIQVTELYESENAIVLQTTLLGPEPDENITETPTYPYIVVRMEYSDKYVMTE